MSEPNGQYASPVMTAQETVIYLRLAEQDDEPETIAKAIRTLYGHVRDGRLKAFRPGGSYLFTKPEVDRFVTDETAAFEPTKRPVPPGGKGRKRGRQ